MHPRAVFACGACRMRGVVGANYPEGLPSGAGPGGLPQSALVAGTPVQTNSLFYTNSLFVHTLGVQRQGSE